MIGRYEAGPWRVLGTGVALPGPPIETQALLNTVDDRFALRISASGQRLAARLGIRARHVCRDFAAVGEGPRAGDSNPELTARAIARAIDAAGLSAAEVGYILGHTTTPATLLPSNIAWVADHLRYDGAYAELRQACTGFAHALQFAVGALSGGDRRPVVIAGSETGSVFVDPLRAGRDIEQLLNFVQMGDGAGAIALGADVPGSASRITSAFVGSLGHGRDPGFWLEAGGSAHPRVNEIPHFRHDPKRVRASGEELFRAAINDARALGIRIEEID